LFGGGGGFILWVSEGGVESLGFWREGKLLAKKSKKTGWGNRGERQTKRVRWFLGSGVVGQKIEIRTGEAVDEITGIVERSVLRQLGARKNKKKRS